MLRTSALLAVYHLELIYHAHKNFLVATSINKFRHLGVKLYFSRLVASSPQNAQCTRMRNICLLSISLWLDMRSTPFQNRLISYRPLPSISLFCRTL